MVIPKVNFFKKIVLGRLIKILQEQPERNIIMLGDKLVGAVDKDEGLEKMDPQHEIINP